VIAHFEGDPTFLDVRHDEWARSDFDLTRKTMPWLTYWGLNFSARRDDFFAVGGFDEELRGWGPEDLDLGYRLHLNGVELQVSRDAWVVAAPHERDWLSNHRSAMINLYRMLRKYQDPVMELGWGITAQTTTGALFPWEDENAALIAWQQKVKDLDVADEIEKALPRVAPATRIAVLGSGGRVPDSLPPNAVLMDFDKDLVTRVVSGTTRHNGYTTMGLRIPVADDSVDAVIVTSRMAGLWGRWSDLIVPELQRVGGIVHTVDFNHGH